MERRLAAILAADMVGFSRMMATDETETIKRQQSQKGAFFDPERKRAICGQAIVKEAPGEYAPGLKLSDQ